jgi:hypothetical protein
MQLSAAAGVLGSFDFFLPVELVRRAMDESGTTRQAELPGTDA